MTSPEWRNIEVIVIVKTEGNLSVESRATIVSWPENVTLKKIMDTYISDIEEAEH